MRLPLGRSDSDKLANWLSGQTDVAAKYFQTKITNKFPGVSDISGTEYHLYIELSSISDDTVMYGSIEDLHKGQTIWVSPYPPKDFDGSRYYQYLGIVSGTIG